MFNHTSAYCILYDLMYILKCICTEMRNWRKIQLVLIRFPSFSVTACWTMLIAIDSPIGFVTTRKHAFWLDSMNSFALNTGSWAQFFNILYLLHQSFNWNNWLGRETGLLNEYQPSVATVLIRSTLRLLYINDNYHKGFQAFETSLHTSTFWLSKENVEVIEGQPCGWCTS